MCVCVCVCVCVRARARLYIYIHTHTHTYIHTHTHARMYVYTCLTGYGLDVLGSKPDRSQDWLWGPSCLLPHEYRSLAGRKQSGHKNGHSLRRIGPTNAWGFTSMGLLFIFYLGFKGFYKFSPPLNSLFS